MMQIGSIAEIRMGATLRGRDATRPVPDGRLQLIRIGDISQEGELIGGRFDRINPGESVSDTLILRPGDVLFPNRGTRTTAFTFRLPDTDVIVGAQFFLLRPDVSIVFPEYLAWFLRDAETAKYFEGRRRGTYVQIIQRADLSELEIPLPPLKVQHQIVELSQLALAERKLSQRLAELKWNHLNNNLLRASKNKDTGKTKL